jgi:AraC-like DNA-binding protein
MSSTGINKPAIFFNHYIKDDLQGESFVKDHIFSYIISGTHEIWSGNNTFSFKAGDYRFFKRNQLARYVKRMAPEGFKSIAVHIDQQTLKDMSHEHRLSANGTYPGAPVALLKPNPYLNQYVESLMPYISPADAFNEAIITLKTKELIFILLQTHPPLKEALFDFSDPGKIDIEAFMHTHFRYNVGLDRIAFLTGRSLSTFKRDFEKTFHTTPGKWLTQKRLEQANYLISKEGKTGTEIYLDLGFEDLSHFSFAYKKAFGISPSKG